MKPTPFFNSLMKIFMTWDSLVMLNRTDLVTTSCTKLTMKST